MVAVGLGLSLAAGTSEAADPRTNIRLGDLRTNWCGFDAVLHIEKPAPNKFKGVVRTFTGTIELTKTRQVDPITIQQLEDGHLHMVRTLTGNHSGESQVTVTHRPELKRRDDGKLIVNWPARRTEGYGAKLLGFVHMTVK